MLLSPSLLPFTFRYTDSEIRSAPKIDCSCVCMLRRHKPGFNLGTLYHHHHHHHHHHQQQHQIIQDKYNNKYTSNRLVFATKTSQSSVMADKEDVKTEATKQQTPTTAEKEKKKELPPPPEKPEAGDCCGSGCVRCVWDVYYDQLDDYNKLLNQSQSPPPPPSQ